LIFTAGRTGRKADLSPLGFVEPFRFSSILGWECRKNREDAMVDSPRTPSISAETVCRIVLKARQFDVKEGRVDPDDSSNAADDGFRSVLEDEPDDPVYQELKAFIDDLDIDEQCEIVALMWVGRGDFDPGDFASAVEMAREEHNSRTAAYLLGTPLPGRPAGRRARRL
jgi:hypothetical protein